MEITRFVKAIRGKPGRLSITIPTSLTDEYTVLDSGSYVLVTIQDRLKDPSIFVKFAKPIAKCGERGRLIYIPMKVAKENELKKDTKVLVILETI